MRNLQLILMLGATVALVACDEDDGGDGSGSFDCRVVGSECAAGFSCVASSELGGGFECAPDAGMGRVTDPAASDSSGDADAGAAMGTGSPPPVMTVPSAPATTDGGAECAQILNCANSTCVSVPAAQQQACLQQCVSAASAEGQQIFTALNQCIATNCVTAGGSIDQGCITQQCAAEASACTAGGMGGGGAGGGLPSPMGTGVCSDLNACALTCGSNQDCALACIEDLSPESFGLYQGMLTCAQSAGCNPNGGDAAFTTCLFMNCRDQYHACEMDGVTAGSGQCGALFDCSGTCMPSNASCQRDCRGQATVMANDLYTNFLVCTQSDSAAAACTDRACQEMACADDLTACRNDMSN